MVALDIVVPVDFLPAAFKQWIAELSLAWLPHVVRLQDKLGGIPVWLVAAMLGMLLLALALRRGQRAQPAAPEHEPTSQSNELLASLKTCRRAFGATFLFSAAVNILMLTGSLFMLEVYDRVLPSRSVATLIGLAFIAGLMYAGHGVLEVIRLRLLGRIGASLSEGMGARVFSTVGRVSMRSNGRDEEAHPVRDLDTIRSFMSGLGPTALFDLPWLPFYLAIIYAFHPVLGVTATIGTLVLAVLTILTDAMARDPSRAASRLAIGRDRITEDNRRKAEVIRAMGMTGAMTRKWTKANQQYLLAHQRLSDVGGGFSSVSKISRVMLQSAMLALGAYLVIESEASSGVIIASSILISRALAPVELAISHWKGFVAARQSWHRLTSVLLALPQRAPTMALPKPTMSLVAKGVAVAPPGGTAILVQEVSFALISGESLGIVGPSGSGKSTLARAVIDVWPPVRGKVRLDGAALDQWEPDVLGQHIGYLPQTSELFAGTIAENISRFAEEPDAEAIIAAAKAAGVHDLILSFEKGYDTHLGPHGTMVSAGQQQRIALARALYGDPFLVVLDEPNSNLDADGESALMRAIADAKSRGAIVLIIAHRPSAIAGVDHLLVMNQGRMVAFGPANEIAAKHLRPPAGPSLKVIQESGRSG